MANLLQYGPRSLSSSRANSRALYLALFGQFERIGLTFDPDENPEHAHLVKTKKYTAIEKTTMKGLVEFRKAKSLEHGIASLEPEMTRLLEKQYHLNVEVKDLPSIDILMDSLRQLRESNVI